MKNKILKNWYLFKRDFLWRHNPSLYKIMIAEFMLQRTKAEQVEPVYKKFLQEYPDIKSLASAKLKNIQKFTIGLGIHGRAPKFINAAKYIVDELNCVYPKIRIGLINIPGVGDYVGGAISAVCFNKADYVIDSNIARFINRFYDFNLKDEIRRKKIIIEKARKLFTKINQRDFLFAILDFTSLICKPGKPLCTNCFLLKKCNYSNKNLVK